MENGVRSNDDERGNGGQMKRPMQHQSGLLITVIWHIFRSNVFVNPKLV